MTTLQSIGDPQADICAGLTDSRPGMGRIRLAEQQVPDWSLTAPRFSVAPSGLHRADWLAGVEDEMLSYLELAPNWDSYGGGPVPSEVVERAILIAEIMAKLGFSRPAVSPESSGGVFLEWEQADRALSVDLDGNDGFSCAYEAPGEQELVGDIEHFVTLLAGMQPF